MRYIQLDAKLSDWAEYVGCDKDGGWWEYEKTPMERISCFYPSSGMCRFLARGLPPANWKNELWKVK